MTTKNEMDRPRDGGLKYCAACASMMVLVRVAPKFGPLPEVRTYKCVQCGRIVEEDIDR
jgi:hypothetical protein